MSTRSRSLVPALYFATFAVFTLIFFLRAGGGMLDDPGLGWHLLIADQMWTSGGFLHQDNMTGPSLGRPFVTYSWLSDVVLRLVEEWGGVEALAALTSLTFAVVLQILLQRMISIGVPILLAIAWTFFALFAILPGVITVPNMFTYVGIAATTGICIAFHLGRIGRRQTLWLLPIFLVWSNAHSGFLSGALVLVATYATELGLSVFGAPLMRPKARRRALWWTGLSATILVITFVNPNGWNLHRHLVNVATDSYIMRGTTVGWMPPDFLEPGWLAPELAILMLPALLARSTMRLDALSLTLCVVFLHYALTGLRYLGLWILISVPILATLALHTETFRRASSWFALHVSEDLRERVEPAPLGTARLACLAFAVAFLLVSPWLPSTARTNLPTEAMDKVLEFYDGRPVLHSANWGGYLSWHGRHNEPRFLNWIDDRLDVHSREHFEDFKKMMHAARGWEAALERHGFAILCLPADGPLAGYVEHDPRWTKIHADDKAVVFRRNETAS